MRAAASALLVAALAGAAAGAEPAGAATRAPLPELARVGNPPAQVAAGGTFTGRFRMVNRSRLKSARTTVTVRLTSDRGARVGLPGKVVVPALRGKRTTLRSRRYGVPGSLAPGTYRVVACIKRAGIRAICRTASRGFVVPDPPEPPEPPPADATAPEVAIAAPAEGADTNHRPLLSGSAGAAESDDDTVTVRLTGPGGPLTLTAPVGTDGTWSVAPAADLAPGRWTAVAEQRDADGNTGTSPGRGFGVAAVLLAGGDIAACDRDGDSQTAALLDSLGGDVVAPLGDLVQDMGTEAEFTNCYDPTWGRAKARTRPAVGNHEYETAGATPYFNYFGSVAGVPGAGWYSYDLGTWHVVVLNSNCTEVACGAGSPQANWLSADLAANPRACTLAYWHHPWFNSSTVVGYAGSMGTLWRMLDNAGADLVLNGHSHTYERFGRQDWYGTASPDGMREIISGTGGYDHHHFGPLDTNSEVRDDTTFGVLKLTLRQAAYDWEFVPVAGGTFTDAGSTACS